MRRIAALASATTLSLLSMAGTAQAADNPSAHSTVQSAKHVAARSDNTTPDMDVNVFHGSCRS